MAEAIKGGFSKLVATLNVSEFPSNICKQNKFKHQLLLKVLTFLPTLSLYSLKAAIPGLQ